MDQIVKIELEAAEVLAGLAANSSVRESGREWGLKGKRARKRVKCQLPTVDSDKKPEFSAVMSAHSQDRSTLEKQHGDDTCRNLKIKTVKAEQAELSRRSTICSKSNGSLCASRSRQNLTEAEKEERRIRRVLANRESARQTIRRRQAICDELTRKAADLLVENSQLKREKELVEREYESLKNMNEYLKEQMASQITSDEVETSKEPTLAHGEIATPKFANTSLSLPNPSPFTPFAWPVLIQSSNSLQVPPEPENSIVVSPKVLIPSIIQSSSSVQSLHENQNAITISPETVTASVAQSSNRVQSQDELHNPMALSSRVPITVFSDSNSAPELENRLIANGPRTPICLLPRHWFFPVPGHGVGFYHHNQDESTVENETNAISSQTLAYADGESCSYKEARPTCNLNETPFGLPPDGGGLHMEANSKPAPISPAIPAVSTKHENRKSQEFLASSLPRKNGVCSIYTSKTQEEVAAAAEARKKRKELTRLKNLRSFRINC